MLTLLPVLSPAPAFANTAMPLPTKASSAVAPVPAARLFISGHSLTAQPLPDYMARVAQSLGRPLDWERQHMGGSSIKDRTRGPGAASGWAGFKMGENRVGSGLDVAAELKGRAYDSLLITEQHGVLDSLVWHDTVRHLRHYHDRFISGNALGRSFFYEPWLGIPGGTDIKRWMSYERHAAPVWQCITARINRSLQAQGRSDRITSLPASLALVELVDRATTGDGLPGISAASPADTIKRLFSDDVHLTNLAFYYIALVAHGIIFEQSPQGAWAPAEVSPVQAATLQQIASDFVSQHRATFQPPTVQACAAQLNGSFRGLYFDFRRAGYGADTSSVSLTQTWRRLKSEANLRWHLMRHDPLSWDVSDASDTSYWFPLP